MIDYIYNLVYSFFDAIGFSNFLFTLYPQADQLCNITVADFFFNTFSFIFCFVVLWFVIKLFFSIINKFIEVIKYD